MSCSNKWDLFAHTGKVEDYLYYKHDKEKQENKWNDNQDGTNNSDRHGDFIDADK